MKKDGFVKGALISTICILFSKILGIIYVIPFYSIIGKQGGALYGYAYNIYILFLSLATVGIPLAISKIISEYATLGFEDAKKRSYKISKIITTTMAVVVTIGLFFGAPAIANEIMKGVTDGNKVEDIALTIRIASSAIFFATLLATTRGYLQGQKYITSSSISQVVEQLVRVIVIVVGSYIFMKLYGIKEAVCVAIFGATVGAIISLVYLKIKARKLKSLEVKDYVIKEEEKKITNKQIFKKIIIYTVPFVIISIIASLYVNVDSLFSVKILKSLNYNTADAEAIVSYITTWGMKLNMIVTSISSGFVVSLLPNITSDFISKNSTAIKSKINKTVQALVVILLPMVVGLSLLAAPVWTVFYGYNEVGADVFTYSIFAGFFVSIYTNVNVIMQSVGLYKKVYISWGSGLLFKLLMNGVLIKLFYDLGLPAYYGSTTASIIGYSISTIFCLIALRKEFKIDYRETIKTILISLFAVGVMTGVIKILQNFIHFSTTSKFSAILNISIFAIIGGGIYGLIIYKSGIYKRLFKRRKIKVEVPLS